MVPILPTRNSYPALTPLSLLRALGILLASPDAGRSIQKTPRADTQHCEWVRPALGQQHLHRDSGRLLAATPVAPIEREFAARGLSSPGNPSFRIP